MLAKLPDTVTAGEVCEQLQQEKLLLRNCSNFKGLSEQFIRFSLNTENVNRMFADKLAVLISDLSNP